MIMKKKIKVSVLYWHKILFTHKISLYPWNKITENCKFYKQQYINQEFVLRNISSSDSLKENKKIMHKIPNKF